MTKVEMKDYQNYLEEKRLNVVDMELSARRQLALYQIKRDYIAEQEIKEKYFELLTLEQEKLAEMSAKAGNITEETNPEVVPSSEVN